MRSMGFRLGYAGYEPSLQQETGTKRAVDLFLQAAVESRNAEEEFVAVGRTGG